MVLYIAAVAGGVFYALRFCGTREREDGQKYSANQGDINWVLI